MSSTDKELNAMEQQVENITDEELNCSFEEARRLFHLDKCSKETLQRAVDELMTSNDEYLGALQETQCRLRSLSEECVENNVSLLYAELKDLVEKLQLENDALKIAASAELQNVKAEFLRLKFEDEATIARLTKEIEEKEKKFFDELAVTQSEYALKYDDMESHMEKLLSESQKKLQEANDINSVLRSELVALKGQFTSTLSQSEKIHTEKISNLEDRLVFTENQLSIAQEKLLECKQPGVPCFSTPRPAYKYNRGSFSRVNNTALETPRPQPTSQDQGKSDYNPLPVRVRPGSNYIESTFLESMYKTSTPGQVASTPAKPKKRRKLYNENDVETWENLLRQAQQNESK